MRDRRSAGRAKATAPTAALVVAVAAAASAVLLAAVVLRAQRNGETRRAAIDAQTVVMFGDSITEEGDWDRLLSDHRTSNHGYSGYTTEELVPIAADVAAGQPRSVYILTGTNDIRDGHPPSWTTDQLGLILDSFNRLSPDTRIVLQTITPRADAPAEVAATNAALTELAEVRGVELLDIHTPLDDGDGGLRPAETRDGIHLSAAGYDRWTTVLIDDLQTNDPADG